MLSKQKNANGERTFCPPLLIEEGAKKVTEAESPNKSKNF